jgi:hypothetical protein
MSLAFHAWPTERELDRQVVPGAVSPGDYILAFDGGPFSRLLLVSSAVSSTTEVYLAKDIHADS